MAALKQIRSINGLVQGDWSRRLPNSGVIASNTEVWGGANNYRFASGLQVTINAAAGPSVRVRYCNTNDFDVNFNQNQCLLLAPDPDTTAPPLPDHTPIRLLFSQPVKAVGCFVAGEAVNAAQFGTPFTAILYPKRQGAANFSPSIANSGFLGHVLPTNSSAGRAPFVGVRDTSGPGIIEICIDLVLMANFRLPQVAISSLYYEL